MTSQSYIRSSAVARWSACGLGCHFVSVEWRSPLTTLTLRGRSQEESGASCRGDSESKISLVGVFGAGCSDTFQVTFYSGWVYFWTVSIENTPQDVVDRIILRRISRPSSRVRF